MKISLLLAAALTLLAPAAAQAQGYAPYPTTYPEPYAAPQPAYTQLRVEPPAFGAVFVFDGPTLIGRFDQAGWLQITTGRAYGVVATRGPLPLWSGFVSATGPTLHLGWGDQAEPYRHEPRYEPQYPGGYYGPGGYHGYPQQQPVLDGQRFWRLLDRMDRAYGDGEKLRVVRAEARRHVFTTAQVGQVLDRFQSDRYRLSALAALKPRIVDREHQYVLSRHFRHAPSRRRAIEMLRW